MPKKHAEPASASDAELIQAIADVIGENDDAVRVPMSVLNQGIADLVAQNTAVIQRVSNVLTRKLTQAVTDNDNDLEGIGTILLTGINGWIQENDLLLHHLAASAGLIQPGDPLTAALVDQVSEAPQIAYSATLLIALREAMSEFRGLIEVLREIRDRMPGAPPEDLGEPAARYPTQAEVDTELAVEPAGGTWDPPQVTWEEV